MSELERSFSPICDCCGHIAWRQWRIVNDLASKPTTSYEYLQCQNCGLVTKEGEKSPETVRSYYSGQSYYAHQPQSHKREKWLAWAFAAIFCRLPPGIAMLRNLLLSPLSQLARGIQITPEARILDLGSGSGRFASVVRALGMHPTAIDSNQKAVDHCLDLGIDAYRIDFDLADAAELAPLGTFDQIVSNHAIEHVASPSGFLMNARELMHDRSILIVSTPNVAGPWSRIFGPYWAQLDAPRHQHLLSPAVLDRLSAKAELRIVKRRHIGGEFGLPMSLVYLLESMRGQPFSSHTRRRLVSLGKILLFPIYSAPNLLRFGDTIEYWLVPDTNL